MADNLPVISTDASVDDASPSNPVTKSNPKPNDEQLGQIFDDTVAKQSSTYSIVGEVATDEIARQMMQVDKASSISNPHPHQSQQQYQQTPQQTSQQPEDYLKYKSYYQNQQYKQYHKQNPQQTPKWVERMKDGAAKSVAAVIARATRIPVFPDFPILLVLSLLFAGCCYCPLWENMPVWNSIAALVALGCVIGARIVCKTHLHLFGALRSSAWMFVIFCIVNILIGFVKGLMTMSAS